MDENSGSELDGKTTNGVPPVNKQRVQNQVPTGVPPVPPVNKQRVQNQVHHHFETDPVDGRDGRDARRHHHFETDPQDGRDVARDCLRRVVEKEPHPSEFPCCRSRFSPPAS